jgi:hypothetical protein
VVADGQGLDEGPVLLGHGLGQDDDVAGGHDQQVGEGRLDLLVDPDDPAAGAALLGSGPAGRAAATGDDRVDRDERALREPVVRTAPRVGAALDTDVPRAAGTPVRISGPPAVVGV